MTTPPDPTSTNWMQSANQVFQPIPIPGSYPQAARTSTPQPQPTGYSSSDSIEYVDDSDGYPVPPSSFSPAPSAPSIDAQAQPTPTSFLNPPPPITQSPLSLHSSQLGPPNAPSIEDPIEPIEYPKNERDHQRTLDPKRFSEAPTSESAHVQDETQKTYTNQAKGLAETIFAVCHLALAIILTLVLFKVTGPIAIGMAIYLKTPLAILPISLTLTNILSIYFFGMMAFKHMRNAWNICMAVTP